MVARLLLLVFGIYTAGVYLLHVVIVEHVRALFIVYSLTVPHHIAAHLFASPVFTDLFHVWCCWVQRLCSSPQLLSP